MPTNVIKNLYNIIIVKLGLEMFLLSFLIPSFHIELNYADAQFHSIAEVQYLPADQSREKRFSTNKFDSSCDHYRLQTVV